MGQDDRLDGWKAIGAHFGRDRSTVIRWARDRGLPVRSVPGGRTRTVYALRTELDAWASRLPTAADAGEPAPPAPDAACDVSPGKIYAAKPGARPAMTLAVAALVGASGLGVTLWMNARPQPAPSLPRDHSVAALYIQARDDWAQRTNASLTRSINAFGRITRLDPQFAPAFASLADAYLLAREDGDLSDAQAYPAARRAADRAASLDPRLAAARRAQGFIAYWYDHDRAAARADFSTAVRLDPADAQTHLWYANILSDNGEDAAAQREYDAARLRDPGSIPIRTERAWALWAAGREAEGAAELATIVTQVPGDEEARDALSVIALARGDTAGYVREMQIRAHLRGQAAFSAWVDDLAQTRAKSGDRAALTAILRHALSYQKTLRFTTDPWAAWVAGLVGDRLTVLDILRRADAAHETWGRVGYQRRIADRWRGDAEIIPLLARRLPPRLEP